MPHLPPAPKYRLIGVRADGTRRKLCDGVLSEISAAEIKAGLDAARPFETILIERETDLIAPTKARGRP